MSWQILRALKSRFGASVIYPLTECYEKRSIQPKLRALKRHYQLPFSQRKKIVIQQLADMVEFAGQSVPYYQELFQQHHFDPAKLRKDPRYLENLPYLTKEIIREQGARLCSRSLAETRHYVCKTGGSTGLSCHFYYDQVAADYAAAIVLFAREQVGKKQHMFELHFASRFPEVFPLKARIREYCKCLAMNRTNIFFDRVDDIGLEEMWQTLRKRKPHLVHAHPSTLYALACYLERTQAKAKTFTLFESSGELLEPYMRDKIQDVLQCQVIDRYGLAEFGVIAYQTDPHAAELLVLDSEVWPEVAPVTEGSLAQNELVFSGFHNRLMPLIRYRTGDLADLSETPQGWMCSKLVGRIHDLITVAGVTYPTHYVQDVLDRVGGIQEFQIDVRETPPKLLIIPEPGRDTNEIFIRLNAWWPEGFRIEFGAHNDLVYVGHRAKFRHVVTENVQVI